MSSSLYGVSLKTSDQETVQQVIDCKVGSTITINGISTLLDKLVPNVPVFVILGGDKQKISWEKGLVGLAQVKGKPRPDKSRASGKKSKYFELDFKILKKWNACDKAVFYDFPDCWDICFIGPSSQGEPNQPVVDIKDSVIPLFCALIELGHIKKLDIKNYFPDFYPEVQKFQPDLKRVISIKNSIYKSQFNQKQSQIEYQTLAPELPYPKNRIFFGAPGSGKSFTLNRQCKECESKYKAVFERVTFYPDFYYSNFFGSYKPCVNEQNEITYRFVPGPFLRLLAKCLKNGRGRVPVPYILVIEELNRAKPANVFGELFQLLDRDSTGVSEYSISLSEEIKQYLSTIIECEPEDLNYLKLPNNFYIWATMNSADQGVYPLDTAFKRRWSFEYMPVDSESPSQVEELRLKINNSEQTISWDNLRRAINYVLSNSCLVREDKLLGSYFLTAAEISSQEKFVSSLKDKVLMYLFEDMSQTSRQYLFSGPNINRLCDLQEELKKNGLNVFSDMVLERYMGYGSK